MAGPGQGDPELITKMILVKIKSVRYKIQLVSFYEVKIKNSFKGGSRRL